MTTRTTRIPHVSHRPALDMDWNAPHWGDTIAIDRFRPEGSGFRPRTELKLCWSEAGISGLFRVDDQYVRCAHTGFQAPVYKDSCVEIFLQPKPGRGYFNFEFNAGGALLVSHVTDPERLPDGGLRQRALLDARQCALVDIAATLPALIEPEIAGPVEWRLAFFIPFALFAEFIGPVAPLHGDGWRGNFYKCGDETSHPHWAAWAPVPELNFHRPDFFGELLF